MGAIQFGWKPEKPGCSKSLKQHNPQVRLGALQGTLQESRADVDVRDVAES